MSPYRRLGTTHAPYTLATTIVASTLMGCLVTQPLSETTDPLCSPTIASSTPPLDELIVRNVKDPGDVLLEIGIVDCNEDQPLEVHWFINGSDAFNEISVPPVVNSALSRTEIRVPTLGALSQVGCHNIEVLVSGSFQSGEGREPVIENDLAIGIWSAANTNGWNS